MVDDKTPVEDAADEIAEDVATFARAVAAAISAGAILGRHLKKHWLKLAIVGVFVGSHAGRDVAIKALQGDVSGAIESLADTVGQPTSCISQRTHDAVVEAISRGHSDTYERLGQCTVALQQAVCPE